MTPLIVLMLIVLWVVVLAPGLWKKHRERSAAGSIDSFHLQLHLLERTGPKIVAPAYRLQSSQSETGMTPGASGFPAVSSMPGRPNLMLVESAENDLHQRFSASVAYPGGVDPVRRHRAAKRRRDAVSLMVLVALSTGLLGALHGLHALWVLSALSLLMLGAYAALVVYAQMLSADRQRPHRAGGAAGSAPSHSRAVAGYPGAWDHDAEGEVGSTYGVDDDEYFEPRRVAAR